MVVSLTPAGLVRPEAQQLERVKRLARQGDRLTVSPDPRKPGGWIVRNPNVPYRIELVNDRGECTCRHYQLWDRCKHATAVLSADRTQQDMSWHIVKGGKV